MRVAVLAALLSHWRARPVQLVMLVVGLSLATALWSGVQAINAEARASYAAAAETLERGALPRLVRADGGRVAQSTYIALRRAGWQVSPVLEGQTRLAGESVTLLGIDPLTTPRSDGPVDMEGGAGLRAFITPPGTGYAAPETVARLSGAQLELRADDAIAPGIVVVDIGIAQRMLDAPGRLSHLLLHDEQPMSRPPLEEVASGLTQRTPGGAGEIASLTDSFHLNLTAFGFLSFAVGLFIVHSAVGLAFEQRRPVLRTMRALGVPARTLLAALVAELLLLAIVAGLIGVALGYLVAALLLPDVAATLRGLYGAEVRGTLSLRPAWWLSGMLIAVLGTLAAAARDLWRTARLPVLATARPRAWALASERTLLARTATAVALALAAWALARVDGGLVTGFAMLGAVLLSAAIALPVVLWALLHLAQRFARGPLSEWFWADSRQQLPGLSMALMALLLALAANVGVGTMVSSFRVTFTGWLDQRLAAELYVNARDEADGRALREWLAPRARAVLPVWHVDADLHGQPGSVYGVADHATYRENWPLLAETPRVWDRVAASEALLVNEQLARAKDLWPGARLSLPGGPELPVAGVYSDYGNPQAQVMIGIELFRALYPEAPRRQHAVRVSPDAAAGLAQDLQRDFGLPPSNITNQAEAKAASLRIFERTFAVTGALNVLTLGVAGVALLASLVTLSGMRLPQLAPVWAIGLPRRTLARLELVRSVLLAAFTMLAALPVGLLLAWVLLAIINVEAFGWRLPMQLFPLDWVRLGVLALLTAVLAAAVPVLRLARMPPSRLVKVFAHER